MRYVKGGNLVELTKRKDIRINRIGEENLSGKGDLMRIIEYYNSDNIVIQFQDKYKAKVHTSYKNFKKGGVRNPYCVSVRGVGIVGVKYPTSLDNKRLKEYITWDNVLYRCFDKDYKKVQPTYKESTVCDKWLLYENFYEWLHSQENFNKWLNGDRWALDKDILIKGNKIYSPDTCCLIPQRINNLFTKQDCKRGDLPIGVRRRNNKFRVSCNNMLLGKLVNIGTYETIEQAFQAYKTYKESYIKQVAQEEYSLGNITKKCYDAMMSYEVEITD